MRRAIALVAALGALLAAPTVAGAHPLGNFTVNRYSLVEVDRGHVGVTFVLDVAEIPTFQDLNGTETPAAARAWADASLPGLVRRLDLEVDGRRVPLVLQTGGIQASLRLGQGGLQIMRVVAPLQARITGGGPFSATYADDTYGSRVGWKEVVMRAGPGTALTRSTASTRDVSHMLRHYPSGMLSTPLDVHSSQFSYRYGAGASIDVAAPKPTGGVDVGVWGSQFTSLISTRSSSAGFIALALLVAMFWGAVHALSPGHGKSIVAAYLVGSRGTARHAVFLGATVTVTHTASILVLGLVTLYLASVISPDALYPWISLGSALAVVGVGLSILGARVAAMRHARAHEHDHHHHHRHHGPGGHSHTPQDGPITVRSMLALGVSGGLIPCPSALVVMLGAIALHRVAFGLVLVVAFSLGLAGTLTAVGLVVVYARRLADRVPSSGRLITLLPTLSAVAISLLGLGLTLQALGTFPGGAPPLAIAGAAAVVAAASAASAVRLRAVRRGHPHHHPRGHAHSHA